MIAFNIVSNPIIILYLGNGTENKIAECSYFNIIVIYCRWTINFRNNSFYHLFHKRYYVGSIYPEIMSEFLILWIQIISWSDHLNNNMSTQSKCMLICGSKSPNVYLQVCGNEYLPSKSFPIFRRQVEFWHESLKNEESTQSSCMANQSICK